MTHVFLTTEREPIMAMGEAFQNYMNRTDVQNSARFWQFLFDGFKSI